MQIRVNKEMGAWMQGPSDVTHAIDSARVENRLPVDCANSTKCHGGLVSFYRRSQSSFGMEHPPFMAYSVRTLQCYATCVVLVVDAVTPG